MTTNLIPRLNLEFDDIKESWEFWKAYGRRTGFGVRKQKFNKTKNDKSIYSSYLYVCNKEGVRKPDKRDVRTRKPRDETRTGCEARMKVKLVDGKYKIIEVVLDHNHPFQPPEAVHLFASHRGITPAQQHEFETAEKAGINQKSAFNLQSQYAGGRDNLGYTRDDVKHYLNSRRQRAMKYGDAGCIFRYFEQQLAENPSFFHAYQMDSEERVTNVF
ncbi:protein FAR1-RELATED SEQUENCE 5-like [Neltuma alba]|uniref:protein FAR1-RELATED SEQUENCE 5-like n=1 Tax=Neltuma alba TaxID=207710 RepID=UPI0010A377DA|nr:protein FAR1-RELATED SEQUENCE 5-like [Prosopis alba]